MQKPDIMELKENSAMFQDGSEESIDTVFYCTGKSKFHLRVHHWKNFYLFNWIYFDFTNFLFLIGYKYSFPFLKESCGVRIDSNMVTPLWKHLVAIENPSLGIVGLPFYVCAFSMFDLQVTFEICNLVILLKTIFTFDYWFCIVPLYRYDFCWNSGEEISNFRLRKKC